MRLKRNITNNPLLRVGIGGNRYVVCSIAEPLVDVCEHIDKSASSIYWSDRFECYAIRIKNKRHKTLIHNCPLVQW